MIRAKAKKQKPDECTITGVPTWDGTIFSINGVEYRAGEVYELDADFVKLNDKLFSIIKGKNKNE